MKMRALAGLFGVFAIVACSSEANLSGDAGTGVRDGAVDAPKGALPSCVTEGLQCQPKGCNAGYDPLPAYDCGAGGGSCCGKSVPKLDAATDATPAHDAGAD